MAASLDLVIVNPGAGTAIYQGLRSDLTAIEPPVWAQLLAAHVSSRGLSVEIIDANADWIGGPEVATRVAALSPRLVAVVVYGHQPSASTQNMPAASEICAAIKAACPEQQILLVGGHVASLPERTLREEAADFVCTGEGFATLTSLCELLGSGAPEPATLARVPDLVFSDRGIVRRTPAASLTQALDEAVPAMPWHLLPMRTYRAHNWHCFGQASRQPYASLYTTLGCPYHCTYCCIQAPFKAGEGASGYKPSVNSYRFWTPEWTIAQIDSLVREHGVKHLKIADEMFVLNTRHVTRLCDLILERGYDLNIWAYARVDTVKPALLDKLAHAGFRWLAFGIEAASERVRDDVQKSFDQELVFSTLERVRSAGINVIGNYIFGLPEDDRSTMQETLDLAIELNCEFANFYCTMAYPGSALYQTALDQGWPLPARWAGYSQHAVDALPLPTRHLSGADVLAFRDAAFDTYFGSERYLAMVTQKFGPAIAAEVRAMTARKLVRRAG